MEKLKEAKAISESKIGIDTEASMEGDQSSLYNKSRKIVYDHDFLMALKNVPKSQQKPKNILNDIVIQDEKGVRMIQDEKGVATHFSLGRVVDKTMDDKSSSNTRSTIHYKSVEVKLKMNNILRCNNLDQSIFRFPENCSPIEIRNQIDQLKKLITAIPFKSNKDFDVILELIISMAMDEPTDAYALSFPCHELIYSSTVLPQLVQKDRLFLLKMRCKKQFNHCLAHEQALADIQECTNKKRKKNILIEYYEQHARYRGKMIGIVRSMSEFILDESTKTEFLIDCFQKLVDLKSETTLRCLCVFLVTTVDHEFYNTASDEFLDIFAKMKAITQNGIISESLRNMMSMVFKMKENHWMNVDFKYYEMLKETDYETYKIEKILSFVSEVNKTCSNPENPVSEEDLNTEDLYSKVGCALDDLPYINLNTFVSQIKTLPIDTLHRLQGVVDLVFEKAVNEPNYSAKYAAMCRELALMQVPLDDGTEEVVNLRKLLIAKCQMELEKNSNEELNRNERLKEIEECTDQERKKELMFILEEDVIKIRLKSVGSVKFIGELFKQQMLTVNIMMRCLQYLIENKNEERLEYLCKLLTTIGNELEGRKIDLKPIFNAIKDIVDEKSNCNVGNRVRFMLQDVIDLRSGQWISRRQDMIPKMVEEIQKEFDSEQIIPKLGDVSGYSSMGSDGGGRTDFGASMEADKNETKAKTLPYKDDQWSPYNKSGKKVYDRDFLMALKNVPKSQQKPKNILNDIVIHDEKARLGDVGRYSSMGGGGGGRTDFALSFNAQTFNKSSSVRGVVKRGSLGKGVGFISFKEDVKLHETENAWKPARYNPGLTHTEEDKKTEELYRKVRGVLNKLTPQKYSTLVSQIKTLPIDTLHRLQGVTDLVFEKATAFFSNHEPNFSVVYALMCRELALMQVPLYVGSKEVVNFKKLLISRCQMEFEKNSNEELNLNERLREIEECTDQERKKELLIDMDEEDRRVRKKSVRNIRFIGELFKQLMLTVNKMMECLRNLIENKDDERLECLCELLTTIGKELEGRKMDLNPIFNEMKDIVDKKSNCRVSSRVRFMLQDVIDLRSGQWIPRRQDRIPKTFEKIQKEFDNEYPNVQTSRGKNSNQQFLVQSDKFKIKHTPKEDEPLGSSQLFGNWVRASNIQKNPQPTPNTVDLYTVVEKITDSDRISMGQGPGRDTNNSKGSSMECSAYKQFDGKGSQSGSQHRSSEGSQSSTPTPASMQPPMRPPPERQQPAPAPPAPEQTKVRLTPEQLERRIKNIIEEYVNDCCSLDEANSDVQMSIPQSSMEQFVHDGYNHILERSKTARIRTGMLFAQLINLGTLTLDSYCAALEKLFEYAEDMIIDIPGLWNYYAELIISPVTEKAISLKRLHKCCKVLICKNFAHNLLALLFKLVIVEKGPNFLVSLWKSSDLSLQEFMPNDKVDSFVTNNHFELLTGSGSEMTIINSNLSYTQIADRLSNFLETNTTFHDITKWVTANLGDRMKEKQFIRTLATVLINSSIHSDKLNLQTLNSYYPFFQRYIDNNPEYELQCLYAIQSIVNKLSHPQGLLLTLFNTLYKDNLISFESFITWEKSNDPDGQENKGIAVKQLTSFFSQLTENDEDTRTSDSEEA